MVTLTLRRHHELVERLSTPIFVPVHWKHLQNFILWVTRIGVLYQVGNVYTPVFGGVHIIHRFSFCVAFCVSSVSCYQCRLSFYIVLSWLPLQVSLMFVIYILSPCLDNSFDYLSIGIFDLSSELGYEHSEKVVIIISNGTN